MPLHHGRTTKGIKSAIGKNISLERKRGYPMKQAIAIAMSTARRDARKARIPLTRISKSGAKFRRRK